MARVKTRRTRPLPKNNALEKWYYKKLMIALNAMAKDVKKRVLEVYKTNPPPSTKPIVANDALTATEMQKLLTTLKKEWGEHFENIGEEISKEFVARGEKGTTKTVLQMLKEKNFTVQFKLNRELQDYLRSKFYENIGLISSIETRYLNQVQNLVFQSVQDGKDLRTLTDELEKQYNISKDEAVRIARDQTNKVSEQVAVKRAKEAGISRGRWIHVPGKKSSRPEHEAMDGKIFYLEDVIINGKLHKKGLYDSRVKRNVMPGELVYCYCTFEFVLDGEE